MRGLAALAGWIMVGIGAGLHDIGAGLMLAGGTLLAAVWLLPVLLSRGRSE